MLMFGGFVCFGFLVVFFVLVWLKGFVCLIKIFLLGRSFPKSSSKYIFTIQKHDP